MFRKIGFIIGLAVWGIGMSSCGYRSICEAQITVKQADSLWRAGQMYGREAGDSTTLAQAYETLNTKLSSLSPQLSTTFAHACYHYGRLLRERENPAAAMECFIHATHTRTRDYHILGRVYSNIGDICHLAGEFPLSYDMFERSANNYLKNGDTLLYYYGMYRMAYEKAVLSEKDSCFVLLDSISKYHACRDFLVSCCIMTKAKAYLMHQQYDSAVYYARLSLPSSATAALIIAQAYDNLGKSDSALVYANQILSDSLADYHDLFDALYIVRKNDSTLCAKDIGDLASQREDIRYYEYEPEKKRLSQAIELLTHDLNHKSDLTWLYVLIATIIVIGGGISIYVHCKRKKHKLISQQVEDLTAQYQNHHKRIEEEIAANCLLLRSSENMINELAWTNYDNMCRIIDRDFYLLASKLRNKNVLSEPEVCLCILVLLDFDRQQMAHLLHYAQSGIGKFKYRVAQKLGTDSKNLRNFLISMAIDEHNE